MYQALPPAFLHEFKGHAIIARKGGEPGNEANPLNHCVSSVTLIHLEKEKSLDRGIVI